MTEPLRRLDVKDTEYEWINAHTVTMNALRQSLAKARVLKYYDVMVPVTVQHDAIQYGLGAVLLQEGQPVFSHHEF